MANPNFDGNPPPLPPPPGTDMTGICFRDQLWLNTYPLDRNFVFDYFALSPFYDRTCNNEQLRMNSIHPLDISHLLKMTGTEYMLSEVIEPNLFVIRKQKRDSAEKVTPMLTYYVLCLGWLDLSSTTALQCFCCENFATDGENDDADDDSAANKETIDFRELKRVDHILASLQRKLQPAPPPPPFPEGYAPPQTTEAEPGSETQQGAEQQQQQQQLPTVDPIIDQGPTKRMKI